MFLKKLAGCLALDRFNAHQNRHWIPSIHKRVGASTQTPLKTHCDMWKAGESLPELGQERGIRSRRCSLITVCIYITSSVSLALSVLLCVYARSLNNH